MKKKIIAFLAVAYLLAAGFVLVLALNTFYLVGNERASFEGQSSGINYQMSIP